MKKNVFKLILIFGIFLSFSYLAIAQADSKPEYKINMTKSAVLKGDFIEVKVIVENKMPEDIKNLIITDNFFSDNFEQKGIPANEFILGKTEVNLAWQKQFDLKPNEIKTFEYSVKVRYLSKNIELKPTLLILDSKLVATSNEAFVMGLYCGDTKCNNNENSENCPMDCKNKDYLKYLIPGLILILSAIIIYIYYKKHKV